MFSDLEIMRLEQHRWFFNAIEEIEDYKVMIDGQKFFVQVVKDDVIIYDKIRKIDTGQGDTMQRIFC